MRSTDGSSPWCGTFPASVMPSYGTRGGGSRRSANPPRSRRGDAKLLNEVGRGLRALQLAGSVEYRSGTWFASTRHLDPTFPALVRESFPQLVVLQTEVDPAAAGSDLGGEAELTTAQLAIHAARDALDGFEEASGRPRSFGEGRDSPWRAGPKDPARSAV